MGLKFIDADVRAQVDKRLLPYMSAFQLNAIAYIDGCPLVLNGAIVLTSLFFNHFGFNGFNKPPLADAYRGLVQLDASVGKMQAMMYSVANAAGVELFDGEVVDFKYTNFNTHNSRPVFCRRYEVADPMNSDELIMPLLDGGLASWNIVKYMAGIIGVDPELFYLPDPVACLMIHNACAGDLPELSTIMVDTVDCESTSAFAAHCGYAVRSVSDAKHRTYKSMTLNTVDGGRRRHLNTLELAGQPLVKLVTNFELGCAVGELYGDY